MQMQDVVSQGFVFTSLTALKDSSAALFLSRFANATVTDKITKLHILLRVISNSKLRKPVSIVRYLSGLKCADNSISNE